jgi:hypothetical protein
VTGRRLTAFIDALVAGRRPGNYRADPEDAEVLRTAITLRAARPGDAVPDPQFVSDLFSHLAEEASPDPAPVRDIRSVRLPRGRAALVSVAAGLVLVGGTAAVTEALTPGALSPAAVQVPHGSVVRTGTFETADGRVMGQIVAYRGSPSWVFMNVGGSNYQGTITCKLQVDNGTTVAVGAFELRGGTGEFSRNIQVDTNKLRGAKLVDPSGAIVASATFT